ncbi:PH and SEC7 domain-containing protein 3-like [Colossoma macropomum]|uniref:PH and SEC7 domain-containing protein 3-like n=1 Tax=Colossoma macropomum TaxID=42526 RepID=UPI0018646E15|nr:PH and SEC7 domain-containing protein 3-like [Colossoma macropomum]
MSAVTRERAEEEQERERFQMEKEGVDRTQEESPEDQHAGGRETDVEQLLTNRTTVQAEKGPEDGNGGLNKRNKLIAVFSQRLMEVIERNYKHSEDGLEEFLECLLQVAEKEANTAEAPSTQMDPKVEQGREPDSKDEGVKEEKEKGEIGKKEVDGVMDTCMKSEDASHEQSTGNLRQESEDLQEEARSLATKLYNLTGFRRSEVVQHLSQNTDFGKMVAREYLAFFNLTGMRLDEALRTFIKACRLAGGTSKQERILAHFADRYHQCNPTSLASKDVVHCLSCAMMLLNVDLHRCFPSVKMSCQDFLNNLRGVGGGLEFPEELCRQLYFSIKAKKLAWDKDDDQSKKTKEQLQDLIEMAKDPTTAVHKTGYLICKRIMDKNAEQTRKGRRAWKPFHAILKGMVLFLQKEEYDPNKGLSMADLKNAISLHHAMSWRVADYKKRPNVLCIRTADQRYFFFQAESKEELISWVTTVDRIAACNSAPVLSAVCNTGGRHPQVLPSFTTYLSPEQQLKSHEAQLQKLLAHLEYHRSLPPMSYYWNADFLQKELIRYTKYVDVLKKLCVL